MLTFLGNLRDMKSSLTSGMILLFCVWLIFGNQVADIQSDDSLAGNMRRLTEYLGPVGTLGLVTFFAYVVGLVLSLDRFVTRYLIFPLRRGRQQGPGLSKNTVQRLEKFLDAAIEPAFARASYTFIVDSIFKDSRKRSEEAKSVEAEMPLDLRLQRLMSEDMDILAVQLLAKREKSYEKYDKARTEAEFRAGITLPIFALGNIVAWRLIDEKQPLIVIVAIYVVAIFVVMSLTSKSDQKHLEANEEIINAIIVGDIEFAPLTILKDISEGSLKENNEVQLKSQISVAPTGTLGPREG